MNRTIKDKKMTQGPVSVTLIKNKTSNWSMFLLYPYNSTYCSKEDFNFI